MDSSTEATVGAGNHIFPADNLCETRDPIRDETRMLDHVRRMTDHSGNENLALRQFYFLPHAPFVLMADIACLDRVGLRERRARGRRCRRAGCQSCAARA